MPNIYYCQPVMSPINWFHEMRHMLNNSNDNDTKL